MYDSASACRNGIESFGAKNVEIHAWFLSYKLSELKMRISKMFCTKILIPELGKQTKKFVTLSAMYFLRIHLKSQD